MYNPLALILAILRILIIIISLIVFLLPYMLYAKIFGTTENQAFKLRRTWVVFAKFILGISTEVSGQPASENALYVCNHRSFADPIILAAEIDTFVIAKAEVSDIPLLGKGAELTGIMYVERHSSESRSAVRETMVRALKQGKDVMVYPEGTTNAKLEIMPYKKGTFIEAAQNNFPVVPIVIEYKQKRDLWQNNTGMLAHHFKQFGKLRTQVKIVIGAPVYSKDGNALKEEIEDWTNANIKRIHKNWDSHFHSAVMRQ